MNPLELLEPHLGNYFNQFPICCLGVSVFAVCVAPKYNLVLHLVGRKDWSAVGVGQLSIGVRQNILLELSN